MPAKNLSYFNTTSTGESKVTVPLQDRIELNNLYITQQDADDFVSYLIQNRVLLAVKVTFSNRKTLYRWDTAWNNPPRITLYKHSMWMLIHELGHIKTGNYRHGERFGWAVDEIYKAWIEWR